MKKDLFRVKSKSELKKVSEKYNAKVPTSLTSQFQNRVNKSDAVQNFRKRQERQLTTLYPTGTV